MVSEAGKSRRDRHRRREPRMMGAGATHTKGFAPMGDKSPKASQKLASQKQAKTDRADQKKKQDIAAKQAPAKKN